MLLLNATLPNVPLPGQMYNSNQPPPPPGQQPPQQWDERNPNNQYPSPQQQPQPSQEYGGLSNSRAHRPSGSMNNLPAMPQGDYRIGPPMDHYQNQDPYGRGAPQQHVTFNQPAPRQRTAIACRYCRRRKIRCSGFENAPDGRCSNCARFNQECIFTPVSSQAQAFVPAHAAYPHLRGGINQQGRGRGFPPVIYGAHGQPLGQVPPPPPSNESYGQEYGGQGRPGYAPNGGPYYDDGAEQGRANQRREPSNEYSYMPDSNSHGPPPISPSSSSGPYQSAYQQTQYGQPMAGPQRSPPQAAYSYDNQPSPGFQNTQSLHPPQVLPPAQSSHTPPPIANQGQAGSGRGAGSMSIQNLLEPTRPERNPTDSIMLNALDRRGGM